MLFAAAQLTVFLVLPWFLIKGCQKNRFLDFLSPVVLCYGIGIAAGNMPFLPLHKALSTTTTTASVILAIPLLLFSTDFGRWLRLAPKTVISFLLCLVAVVLAAGISNYVFADAPYPFWKISGMMVGTFTGGTPNMTAIGKMLEVQQETYILVAASEIVVSGVFLLFLMTVAQRLYHLFLPKFEQSEDPENNAGEDDWIPDLGALERKHQLFRLGLALLASAGIAAVSAGAVYLVLGSIPDAPVLLLITSLGIAGSFWRPVRTLPGSYELGNYLLLIFSLAVGSLADFGTLVSASGTIFAYCAMVLVLSTVFHLIFVYFFKIDADTVIITATASLFGPAFIGPVAGALKNREIVVSGLTTGLVGYAVGNYLGLALAYFLQP